MNLRGAANNKRWKEQRRKRACAEIVDLRERHVIVDGIEYDVEFEFALNGHEIGKVKAKRVYFENGQRIAEIEWTYRADVDLMTSRLLKAFFNVEAR